MLEEHFFECPYCWQRISMMLDLSQGGQSYVEDCEICCNPITISYESEEGAVASFTASALQE
jgi:Cysteine-rich CPXCG